jgi:hypothetical protein
MIIDALDQAGPYKGKRTWWFDDLELRTLAIGGGSLSK